MTTLLDHPAPIVDLDDSATRPQFLAGLVAAGLLAGYSSDSADFGPHPPKPERSRSGSTTSSEPDRADALAAKPNLYEKKE